MIVEPIIAFQFILQTSFWHTHDVITVNFRLQNEPKMKAYLNRDLWLWVNYNHYSFIANMFCEQNVWANRIEDNLFYVWWMFSCFVITVIMTVIIIGRHCQEQQKGWMHYLRNWRLGLRHLDAVTNGPM